MAEHTNFDGIIETDLPSTIYRPAQIDDLDTIAALEAASYPEDEAASYDRLKSRIEQAPDLFQTAVALNTQKNTLDIVGFVCGTLTKSDSLTVESMSTHENDGTTLCIHSVCVKETERRKGIALKLLKVYISFVTQLRPELKTIELICKKELIPLYEKAGFSLLGLSDIVHGASPWFAMQLIVN